ncbi:putative monooxygenase [Xylariaceae sp. FL0804]|nr:putative monooxygenase [Xylariaceae sp. FL0804]
MTTGAGNFLEGKRIVVVGGGIAGAAFVAALDQKWPTSLKRPEVLVFERETKEVSIKQNPYWLTLNGENHNEGMFALRELGFLEEAQRSAIMNSGLIKVYGDDWRFLASINGKAYGDLPTAAMRIQREDLKRILIGHADKDKVFRYGCSCTSAERQPNGQIRLTVHEFEAGNTLDLDCDLLVAADGPSSNLRATFRPDDVKLHYAGATQIGGISRLSKLPPPVQDDYGLQMSSGEGVCCIYTPFDNNTIGWALSKVEPERPAKSNLTQEEFEALKKEALTTGSMFQEPFKTIVEATEFESAFILPAKEKHAFQHDARLRGVVFIGDANHVLSPFEYVGANLALKDGVDLASEICSNVSLDAAVAAYDKLSVPRHEAVLKHSHERIVFGHSTGWKWKVYKYGMAAQRHIAKK